CIMKIAPQQRIYVCFFLFAVSLGALVSRMQLRGLTRRSRTRAYGPVMFISQGLRSKLVYEEMRRRR
ncbi:hypothetical protein ACC690_38565, partial [Rhizobium johnstonii]|uniref:hypothetical protein n=1 Tax=Rhizobium johnstonii TaxID=3019933 RepID=UPI003F9ACF13